MKMEIDFEGGEVAEVLQAIALRMQELTRKPATKDNYDAIGRLNRFANKLKPVIERGVAESNEAVGRLN